MKVLMLNGPGLASAIQQAGYDQVSPELIEQTCIRTCQDLALQPDFRQSADDQQIVQWLREDLASASALLINPLSTQVAEAASYAAALVRALDEHALATLPIIEVHLSNPFADTQAQPLRPTGCNIGLLCGFGLQGYVLAIQAMHRQLAASS